MDVAVSIDGLTFNSPVLQLALHCYILAINHSAVHNCKKLGNSAVTFNVFHILLLLFHGTSASRRFCFNCGAKALFCLVPGTCGIKNTISGLIITKQFSACPNSGGVFLGGVFFTQ